MIGIFLYSIFMYLHYMNIHSHILIIGGGLAGLTSAIHLAKKGVSVVLIEKDSYPKHKVCGEYISNEVLPYFDFLDIDLSVVQPTKISKFFMSTQRGKTIHSTLPLGGFGVSRYTLDHYLWQKAKSLGVQLINDQVIDVDFKNDIFHIKTNANIILTSTYVIGAYGKRSILDKTLKRAFAVKKSPWLAVKAHYKANFNEDTVALHNFKGGYCGLSKVENNIVNACYLVKYANFKRYKNLDVFQKDVLYDNIYLNDFFENAQLLYDKPLTIAQVSFNKKKPVEDHIFMVGDSAGLIHPLCGNGMAMAIQSSKMLCTLLVNNHKGIATLSRAEIEKQYNKQWSIAFSKRLYTGRILQKVLLNANLQHLSYKISNIVPSIVPKIIKHTHGEPITVC